MGRGRNSWLRPYFLLKTMMFIVLVFEDCALSNKNNVNNQNSVNNCHVMSRKNLQPQQGSISGTLSHNGDTIQI
jgi:hypothetical protein